MARILLIETATEICSVALAAEGRVLALCEDLPPADHAARITLLIDACVQQSGIPLRDLDAVAVSRGPGSYTGLRVGASAAKGICYALGKPLIAVDTLEALAWAALQQVDAADKPGALLLPMIDARRQEVWTAAYDGALHCLAPAQPLLLTNELFENFISHLPDNGRYKCIVIAGSGSDKAVSGLNLRTTPYDAFPKCSAAHLAALAERHFLASDFQDVSYFEPFYMKPPNITVPKNA